MSYPKSFIKTINGNGVEKIAQNPEDEARLKADGFALMGVEEPEKPKSEKDKK